MPSVYAFLTLKGKRNLAGTLGTPSNAELNALVKAALSSLIKQKSELLRHLHGILRSGAFIILTFK